MDLAVQVDGCKVGEGEHPEGETGDSGVAVLNQLHCTILFIRTPERQGGLKYVVIEGMGMMNWRRVTETALLFTNEIPADRVAGIIERRRPARVQNGGDLPFINSHRLHLDVQPLIDFHL